MITRDRVPGALEERSAYIRRDHSLFKRLEVILVHKCIAKLAKILSYYCLFLLVIYVAIHYYALTLNSRDLPTNVLIRISSFNREVRALKSNERSPRIILVGPSYVALMGNPFNSDNLALYGASPRETAYIIDKYCGERDRVIYPINLWEVTKGTLRNDIRPEAKSGVARDLILFKAVAENKFKMSSPSAIDALPKISPSELRTIRNLLDDQEASITRTRIVKGELAQIEKFESVNAEHYEKVKAAHNNVIYIFIPILPMRHYVTDDENLAREIEYAKNLERMFIADLDERGVEYLALSFEPKDYNDIFHLNFSGMTRMRVELLRHGYFHNRPV